MISHKAEQSAHVKIRAQGGSTQGMAKERNAQEMSEVRWSSAIGGYGPGLASALCAAPLRTLVPGFEGWRLREKKKENHGKREQGEKTEKRQRNVFARILRGKSKLIFKLKTYSLQRLH